jgi:hypothetical protein
METAMLGALPLSWIFFIHSAGVLQQMERKRRRLQQARDADEELYSDYSEVESSTPTRMVEKRTPRKKLTQKYAADVVPKVEPPAGKAPVVEEKKQKRKNQQPPRVWFIAMRESSTSATKPNHCCRCQQRIQLARVC